LKKIFVLLSVGFGLFISSNIVEAEEVSVNNSYSSNTSITKQIDSEDFEIYDEQGNLLDSNDFVVVEHTPMFQSRSSIQRKEVTVYRTFYSVNWPQSYYLRYNDGWQGTMFYKSYYANSTLWGTSYQVNYAGSLFKW